MHIKMVFLTGMVRVHRNSSDFEYKLMSPNEVDQLHQDVTHPVTADLLHWVKQMSCVGHRVRPLPLPRVA